MDRINTLMAQFWLLFEPLNTRARLGVLLALIIAPMSALLIYSTIDRHQLLQSNMQNQTLHLAQMAAENQNEVVAHTRQLLAAFANNPAIKRQDWQQCNVMLEEFWQHFKDSYSIFHVADSKGNVLCSGKPLPAPVNVFDRQDFQDALATGQFIVGDLMASRTTGLLSVMVRYPVVNDQGSIVAVATAQISTTQFAHMASAIPLPKNRELIIADRTGKVIVHHAQAGDLTGQHLPAGLLLDAMLLNRSGIVEAQGVDGIKRLYGYSSTGKNKTENIHVAIGFPLATISKELNRKLINNIAIMLAVVVSVLLLAWFGVDQLLLRKVRILVDTVHKISQGDNSARTGLPYGNDELSQIARAVDETAVELERMLHLLRDQAAELQASNAALIAEKGLQEELIRKLADAHNLVLQSEKLASIGQLAAGVAHEINNPVGYVYSNLNTLQRYTADLFKALTAYEQCEKEMSAETQDVLNGLKHQLDLAYVRDDVGTLLSESIEGLQRVRRIVQDLRDFSHVDESERQWAYLEQGLDSTLNVIWNELKHKADVVKKYGDIPEIECYPSQLNQVFMNLLLNAVQAIEDHGRITIRTGLEGENVWVEVEDTGKGIMPENLGHIFEPFFTTKPVGQGTGLGLSLAYGIIRKHGGQIVVNSEPGKGTVFRVILPRHLDTDSEASA